MKPALGAILADYGPSGILSDIADEARARQSDQWANRGRRDDRDAEARGRADDALDRARARGIQPLPEQQRADLW